MCVINKGDAYFINRLAWSQSYINKNPFTRNQTNKLCATRINILLLLIIMLYNSDNCNDIIPGGLLIRIIYNLFFKVCIVRNTL